MSYKFLFCFLLIAFLVSSLHAESTGGKDLSVTDRMDIALLADNGWQGGEKQPDNSINKTQNSEKKSLFKAVLYSTLVPGGGQLYYGNKTKAKYFIGVEAITWIGYLSFHTYGGWREDDMINFAATYANASLDGKSDDFIDLIGFYDSIDDYNSLGRAYDPERPYLIDNAENHWVWQSRDDRQKYRDLKNRSREAYRRADFMIGLGVVNRIISVIDAVRGTSRANRHLGGSFSLDGNTKFELSVNPESYNRQLALTINTGL